MTTPAELRQLADRYYDPQIDTRRFVEALREAADALDLADKVVAACEACPDFFELHSDSEVQAIVDAVIAYRRAKGPYESPF